MPLGPPKTYVAAAAAAAYEPTRFIYDDPFCYDHSETDCLSDNAADVTEIYRRKPLRVTTCYHQQSAPPVSRYYKEQYRQQMLPPSPPPVMARSPPPIDCIHLNSSLPNANNLHNISNKNKCRRHCRNHYENPDQCEPVGLFRSLPYVSTNNGNNMRIYQDPEFAPRFAASKKKYPVTVKTPRYYRCPTTTLYKRPSRLCLPMSCEPDPAVYRRPRRSPDESMPLYYPGGGAAAGRKVIYPTFADHPIRTDSTTMQEVHDDDDNPRKIDSEGDLHAKPSESQETYEKIAVSDFTQYLRPRVPASVRAKREHITKLKASKLTESDVQNFATGSLEAIHDRLIKCEEVLSRKSINKSKDSLDTSSRRSQTRENPASTPTMSLMTVNVPATKVKRRPSLDDNYALELQRSKNYIISLIDKAMSVELGTVPDAKCVKGDFEKLNVTKAIGFLNKHTKQSKVNNETINNDDDNENDYNRVDKRQALENNASSKTGAEDLVCLKQLKVFKKDCIYRIQSNVKKLEEIDTFLEMYNEN